MSEAAENAAVYARRIMELEARLALSQTDRGSLFARLCETEARLAEAERLLREAGVYWQPERVAAFLSPADSAPGEKP